MTVAPGGAGRTDAGFVGFDPAKPGQFLIFPKSLRPFEGARVVGIKFDLVAQPKFASARELTAVAPASRSPRARRARPPPATSKETPTEVPSASPARSGPRRSSSETVATRATAPDRADADSDVVPFEPPSESRTSSASSAEGSSSGAAPRSPRSGPSRRPRRERSPIAGGQSERKRAAAPVASREDPILLRAVRAAMKDLQRGRSVAAYQRLERAVGDAQHTTKPAGRASRNGQGTGSSRKKAQEAQKLDPTWRL